MSILGNGGTRLTLPNRCKCFRRIFKAYLKNKIKARMVPWWYHHAQTTMVQTCRYCAIHVIFVVLAPLGSNAVSQIACESNNIFMCCPNGTGIDIQSSHYGRTVPYKEMCYHHKQSPKTDCEFTKPKYISGCNGERSCPVGAMFYPDPCQGVLKYLNVTFSCKYITHTHTQINK